MTSMLTEIIERWVAENWWKRSNLLTAWHIIFSTEECSTNKRQAFPEL